MGVTFSKRHALHGLTEAFACFACLRRIEREVLKTSPPYKAQVRKTVRDGKAWNSNSKAGNLNFLRAQRVGYAAQILETFAIAFSLYFGTNTDASRARVRARSTEVCTFYFHLSPRASQMCKCADVQICKYINALYMNKKDNIKYILIRVTANSHEGVKIRHGLKISVMRMYRKKLKTKV